MLSALVGLGLLIPVAVQATETASYAYTYDAVGRVATAFNAASGVCIAYTYDANGNHTAQIISVSGGAVTPVWGSGTWGCFPWMSQ